jgi:hypothetical protein
MINLKAFVAKCYKVRKGTVIENDVITAAQTCYVVRKGNGCMIQPQKSKSLSNPQTSEPSVVFPDVCSNEHTCLGIHKREKVALGVDDTRVSARTG